MQSDLLFDSLLMSNLFLGPVLAQAPGQVLLEGHHREEGGRSTNNNLHGCSVDLIRKTARGLQTWTSPA